MILMRILTVVREDQIGRNFSSALTQKPLLLRPPTYGMNPSGNVFRIGPFRAGTSKQLSGASALPLLGPRWR